MDTQYRALLIFLVQDRDEALEIPLQLVLVGYLYNLLMFKLVVEPIDGIQDGLVYGTWVYCYT